MIVHLNVLCPASLTNQPNWICRYAVCTLGHAHLHGLAICMRVLMHLQFFSWQMQHCQNASAHYAFQPSVCRSAIRLTASLKSSLQTLLYSLHTAFHCITGNCLLTHSCTAHRLLYVFLQSMQRSQPCQLPPALHQLLYLFLPAIGLANFVLQPRPHNCFC